MPNESTNLLPPERQRALARDYYVRLGTITALVVSLLFVAAAILLLPTYVFLMKNENSKEAHLATIASNLASQNEKELSARLAALTANATTLTALASSPSASATIRSILAVSRPGITLSRLAYSPATKKGPSTLSVSGTAATRDALRNYQLALQGAPSVRTAALPVSAYAQDTNIEFTITITFAP